MVSMDDVARAAGVSTATVSRVLNNRAGVSARSAEKVRIAVEDLGYVMSAIASGLASGRTKSIGVIVPDLSRWYFSKTINGIAERLGEFDHDLTVYSLSGKQGSRRAIFEEALRRHRVDGFIVISQEMTVPEIERLQELGKPVVGLVGQLRGVRTLGIDECEISKTATQYLIDLGHKRIAHIAGSREFRVEFNVPKTREAGYRSALADNDIPVDESLIIPCDFTIAGGSIVTKILLARDQPPTAIFAASDEMAIGAIIAIREAGLQEGKDISVIGVDGHELGAVFGLTTIAQYPSEQGKRAVDALMAELYPHMHSPLVTPQISNQVSEDSVILLDTDFIVRTSTGPMRP